MRQEEIMKKAKENEKYELSHTYIQFRTESNVMAALKVLPS